jgi:hypothetical protein
VLIVEVPDVDVVVEVLVVVVPKVVQLVTVVVLDVEVAVKVIVVKDRIVSFGGTRWRSTMFPRSVISLIKKSCPIVMLTHSDFGMIEVLSERNSK